MYSQQSLSNALVLMPWLAILVEPTSIGIIGTEITPSNLAFDPEFGDPRFCLNTANRANASGYISSVNYCYVPDFNNQVPMSYQATVGIYRPFIENPSDEAFQLVVSFKIAIVDNSSQVDRSVFRCDVFNDFPPIAVQASDAIGVCSMNFENLPLGNVRRLVLNADTDISEDVLRCRNDLCGSVPGFVPHIVDSNEMGNELSNQEQRVSLINAVIVSDIVDPTAQSNAIATTLINSDSRTGTSHQDLVTIVTVVCVTVAFVVLVTCSVVALGIVAAVKINRKRDCTECMENMDPDETEGHPGVNYSQVKNAVTPNLAAHPNRSTQIIVQNNPSYPTFQGTQTYANIETQTHNL